MNDMKRALARASLSVLSMLVLAACSDGGDGTPSGGAGGAGGAGSAGSGGAGGAGGTGGAAGTMNVAGSGGAGGSAGAAGAAGAAGSAGAAGAAGAAGTSAEDGGVSDADTSDGEAPDDTRPPATSLELPTVMEAGGVEPWFNVYRPMDLDAAIEATGGALPVIVWANGGCFRSDFTWAPLFERWASAGFIVLALTASPDEGDFGQTNVEHHGQLVDWTLAQAEEGMYAGKLDTDRIVAAGNSCGGITALGLTAQDARVTSVFVLSGSSSVSGADLAVMDAITVPVGYVVGGSDDIAGANATADYEALAEGIPAMIVSRSTGDHITVSTDTMILPEVAEIALNWIDLTLYGTPEAEGALTSADVCASCTPGDWTLKEKNLATLKR